MTETEREKLLAELNHELESSVETMDTNKIEQLIEALSGDIKVTASDKKDIYRKIVREAKANRAQERKSRTKLSPLLVAAIILLLSVSVFAVSANYEKIMDGLRWIGDKLIVRTTNTTETNMQLQQQLDELINSKEYILPRTISNMSIINITADERDDECSDICLEFAYKNGYWNLIISTYEDSRIANFEAPATNIEPFDQFAVGEITVTVFKVDNVLTACYSYKNHSYQITSDIDESDFFGILQQIEIEQ